MWVFLNDAFLSIVADKTKRGHLLVRARRRQDIGRVFPEARQSYSHATDYAYRASLPVAIVAEALAGEVRRIDYRNFKDSVREVERQAAYLRVWEDMFTFQRPRRRRLEPPALVS